MSTFQGPGKKNILVCVTVYNRPNNILRWLKAWESCNKYMDAKLAVIVNCDGPIESGRNQAMINIIKSGMPDLIVARPNIGFDIGAFQDLCKYRLGAKSILYDAGHDAQSSWLTNWDVVHWVVDDCVPLATDFLPVFVDKLYRANVGIVGAQISTEHNYHIRTNFFSMRKEIATKIKFPVETITTKWECYDLEHGMFTPSRSMSFQLLRMGYTLAMPGYGVHEQDMLYKAWDIGHFGHLDLWERFWREFPDCRTFGKEQVNAQI